MNYARIIFAKIAIEQIMFSKMFLIFGQKFYFSILADIRRINTTVAMKQLQSSLPTFDIIMQNGWKSYWRILISYFRIIILHIIRYVYFQFYIIEHWHRFAVRNLVFFSLLTFILKNLLFTKVEDWISYFKISIY